MELLLITENENKHYILIKDFNKFMYNPNTTQGKKALLYALSSRFELRKSPKQSQRQLYSNKWNTSSENA